jgi:drug/metabolite transporter (DMT)-like permease|tara:strand:- start:2 stop:850 length:849 start_codon:yes stop_codon:yes gene_type:complete
MTQAFPLIFILLWSSAFISGKVIVQDSTPFAALAFRFAIVSVGFFLFSLIKKEKIFGKVSNIFESLSTGILFHGIYLGGCWYAFYIGMPAAIVALIVTLQPILTNILSGPLFGEKITWKQWLGIVFGFTGSLLVLGIDFQNELPRNGVIISIVALSAITIGTLWQKKLSGKLSLAVNNGYQAIGGCLFNILLMFLFETPYINFTLNFILGMSHQILLVSFGAFTILMYLIKSGSVSKTTTLFFLVPPTSAVMAYFFINENLTIIDILGLIIATFGVYIATRK